MDRMLLICLAASLCASMFGAVASAQDNDELPPWIHTFTPERVLYVGPEGGGDGSNADAPITIQQAVAAGRAGDLFWFLPGVYRADLNLTGRGTLEQPIVFRAVPNERVTIEGTIQMGGAYNWIWGFEITDPQHRDHPVQARGSGVHIINNIIHNAGGGIGGWNNGPDHVYYGNIICHVGGDLETRAQQRTNYPTYTQNNYDDYGYKYFIQNMFLNGRPWPSNYNFHAYTEGGYVSGFHIENNIMEDGQFILGGGNVPHHHNHAIRNYFFNMPVVRFGWGRPIQAEIRDNYIGRSILAIPMLWGAGIGEGEFAWEKPMPNVVTGNTVIHPPREHVQLRTCAYIGEERVLGGALDPADIFDENTYTRNFRASLNAAGTEGTYNLQEWTRATAEAGNQFDANSREIDPPTEPFVAIMANEYESGRGHMVIYNWGKADSVTADLSDIVETGQGFQVHLARRTFDDPVVEGVYQGPVEIPMQDIEFDAFLVRVLPERE